MPIRYLHDLHTKNAAPVGIQRDGSYQSIPSINYTTKQYNTVATGVLPVSEIEVDDYQNNEISLFEPATGVETEYAPFPVDCLPPVLRDIVVEGARSRNLDTAYFVPVLPIVASVIGSRYNLAVTEDWLCHSILWMAVVANSGSGKSPALELLFEPLEELQSIANDEYAKQLKSHWNDEKQYEVDFATWKTNRKSKDIDKMNPTPPPQPPDPPQLKEYFVEDSTTEALLDVLSRNEDGVLSVHDELAGFFGSFNAYRSGSNKDEPFYNRAFDGRPSKTNRKSTDKKVLTAKHTHTSICGGIPPRTLTDIVTKNYQFLYSGLLARMQFVMPPDTKRTLNSPVPKEVKTAYYKLFHTLIAWRKEEQFMSPDKPYRVQMTEEAKEVFWSNLEWLESIRVASETPDVLKSIISKMEGITGRIALVLHIAEFASRCPDGKFPQKIPPVEQETMENAVQIAHWLLQQTQQVINFIAPMEMLGGQSFVDDREDREEEVIIDAIENKGRITKEELHNYRVFRDADHPAERIDNATARLVNRRMIVSEFIKDPDGGAGRSYYRFPTAADSETIENTGGNESFTVSGYEPAVEIGMPGNDWQ